MFTQRPERVPAAIPDCHVRRVEQRPCRAHERQGLHHPEVVAQAGPRGHVKRMRQPADRRAFPRLIPGRRLPRRHQHVHCCHP